MVKLSVVISAFNEEKMIADCLESVKFADEIILVNSSSTDNTQKIASKYTKKIYTRENNLMLNINKNYGFTKAEGNWILSLDADERITPELEEEIKKVLTNSNSINGYWIPRKNIIFGKWIQHSLWYPDYQLRLFKRGFGKFPEKHVHEMVSLEGDTEKLKSPMVHYNYSSISQYLSKMDSIYTESEAENYLNSGKKITWVDALRFPVNDFLKTFFAQKGYKDGLHGLVLSILQAFYSEVVFAKIWERQGFKEYNDINFLRDFYNQSKKIKKEFKYWFLTEFISNTNNKFKKISLRIARKL